MDSRHSTLLDGTYIGTQPVKPNSPRTLYKYKMKHKAFQRYAIDEKAGTSTCIITDIAMLKELHELLLESHILGILQLELELLRCGRTYGLLFVC